MKKFSRLLKKSKKKEEHKDEDSYNNKSATALVAGGGGGIDDIGKTVPPLKTQRSKDLKVTNKHGKKNTNNTNINTNTDNASTPLKKSKGKKKEAISSPRGGGGGGASDGVKLRNKRFRHMGRKDRQPAEAAVRKSERSRRLELDTSLDRSVDTDSHTHGAGAQDNKLESTEEPSSSLNDPSTASVIEEVGIDVLHEEDEEDKEIESVPDTSASFSVTSSMFLPMMLSEMDSSRSSLPRVLADEVEQLIADLSELAISQNLSDEPSPPSSPVTKADAAYGTAELSYSESATVVESTSNDYEPSALPRGSETSLGLLASEYPSLMPSLDHIAPLPLTANASAPVDSPVVALVSEFAIVESVASRSPASPSRHAMDAPLPAGISGLVLGGAPSDPAPPIPTSHHHSHHHQHTATTITTNTTTASTSVDSHPVENDSSLGGDTHTNSSSPSSSSSCSSFNHSENAEDSRPPTPPTTATSTGAVPSHKNDDTVATGTEKPVVPLNLSRILSKEEILNVQASSTDGKEDTEHSSNSAGVDHHHQSANERNVCESVIVADDLATHTSVVDCSSHTVDDEDSASLRGATTGSTASDEHHHQHQNQKHNAAANLPEVSVNIPNINTEIARAFSSEHILDSPVRHTTHAPPPPSSDLPQLFTPVPDMFSPSPRISLLPDENEVEKEPDTGIHFLPHPDRGHTVDGDRVLDVVSSFELELPTLETLLPEPLLDPSVLPTPEGLVLTASTIGTNVKEGKQECCQEGDNSETEKDVSPSHTTADPLTTTLPAILSITALQTDAELPHCEPTPEPALHDLPIRTDDDDEVPVPIQAEVEVERATTVSRPSPQVVLPFAKKPDIISRMMMSSAEPTTTSRRAFSADVDLPSPANIPFTTSSAPLSSSSSFSSHDHALSVSTPVSGHTSPPTTTTIHSSQVLPSSQPDTTHQSSKHASSAVLEPTESASSEPELATGAENKASDSKPAKESDIQAPVAVNQLGNAAAANNNNNNNNNNNSSATSSPSRSDEDYHGLSNRLNVKYTASLPLPDVDLSEREKERPIATTTTTTTSTSSSTTSGAKTARDVDLEAELANDTDVTAIQMRRIMSRGGYAAKIPRFTLSKK